MADEEPGYVWRATKASPRMHAVSVGEEYIACGICGERGCRYVMALDPSRRKDAPRCKTCVRMLERQEGGRLCGI